MAFEIRVPKSMALGRLRPSAVRVFWAAPGRLGVRSAPERRRPAPVLAEDVELEVRERLYGARPGAR
jgi:hypothetical protein